MRELQELHNRLGNRRFYNRLNRNAVTKVSLACMRSQDALDGWLSRKLAGVNNIR